MTATAADAGAELNIERGTPIFAYRIFTLFAALAILSLLILAGGKIYGRALIHAGHTTDVDPFEVIVGNDVLLVTANTIRNEEQRQSGPADRLDLYFHWPTLSGFSAELAPAFNDISPDTNAMIFATIVPRSTTKDMAGRFDAVYRYVTRGGAEPVVAGLKSHALSREHGYIDERLVFSAPDMRNNRRFVVRCQQSSSAEKLVLAPCETDIHIGETVSVQLRFPERLLSDWKRLNAELPAFLNAMLLQSGN